MEVFEFCFSLKIVVK